MMKLSRSTTIWLLAASLSMIACSSTPSESGREQADAGSEPVDAGRGQVDAGGGRIDGGQGQQQSEQPVATGNYPTARNGDVLLGNPDYPAISYGGFRTNERTEANVPTVAEIKEDLRLMQAMGIKMLRTYYTQGFSDTANLLVAIQELKTDDPSFEMYVMLGVWIHRLTGPNQNNPSNYLERARAVEMVQAYPDIIKAISVGNEAMVLWAPYHVAPGIILEHVTHLQNLKASGDIPADVWITSSDNWAAWSGQGAYAKPDLNALAAAVDFVSVHTYPFHDTHFNDAFWLVPEDEQGLAPMQQVDRAMQRATDYALSQVKSVRDYLNSQGLQKQIHIGETGWSSFTNSLYGDSGSKAADEYKQKAFFTAMRAWSDEYGASLFYFQAFDVPWKGDPTNPGDSEKHFGLINIEGEAKYLLWDLVDQGAFDGLTRGGLAITKSHGGDEQSVLNTVLPPPPEPVVGAPIEGNEYVVMDSALAEGLRTIVWEDTSWLAEENGVLMLTTPPTAGTVKSWGWGAGLQYQAQAGLNLTGFEAGSLTFEVRGDTTTDIQIGFQTGIFASVSRPQTNNFAVFGPGGRSITGDWQAYALPMSEIMVGAANLSDVTSPFYFFGTGVDGGVIEVRNVRFTK